VLAVISVGLSVLAVRLAARAFAALDDDGAGRSA